MSMTFDFVVLSRSSLFSEPMLTAVLPSTRQLQTVSHVVVNVARKYAGLLHAGCW